MSRSLQPLSLFPLEDRDQVDSEDLDRRRRRSGARLRSRFESIFNKYERDFTGVGDEIDLRTQEVLVDNGHLESMRNARDTGVTRNVSRRVLLEEESEDDELNLEGSRRMGDERLHNAPPQVPYPGNIPMQLIQGANPQFIHGNLYTQPQFFQGQGNSYTINHFSNPQAPSYAPMYQMPFNGPPMMAMNPNQAMMQMHLQQGHQLPQMMAPSQPNQCGWPLQPHNLPQPQFQNLLMHQQQQQIAAHLPNANSSGRSSVKKSWRTPALVGSMHNQMDKRTTDERTQSRLHGSPLHERSLLHNDDSTTSSDGSLSGEDDFGVWGGGGGLNDFIADSDGDTSVAEDAESSHGDHEVQNTDIGRRRSGLVKANSKLQQALQEPLTPCRANSGSNSTKRRHNITSIPPKPLASQRRRDKHSPIPTGTRVPTSTTLKATRTHPSTRPVPEQPKERPVRVFTAKRPKPKVLRRKQASESNFKKQQPRRNVESGAQHVDLNQDAVKSDTGSVVAQAILQDQTRADAPSFRARTPSQALINHADSLPLPRNPHYSYSPVVCIPIRQKTVERAPVPKSSTSRKALVMPLLETKKKMGTKAHDAIAAEPPRKGSEILLGKTSRRTSQRLSTGLELQSKELSSKDKKDYHDPSNEKFDDSTDTLLNVRSRGRPRKQNLPLDVVEPLHGLGSSRSRATFANGQIRDRGGRSAASVQTTIELRNIRKSNVKDTTKSQVDSLLDMTTEDSIQVEPDQSGSTSKAQPTHNNKQSRKSTVSLLPAKRKFDDNLNTPAVSQHMAQHAVERITRDDGHDSKVMLAPQLPTPPTSSAASGRQRRTHLATTPISSRRPLTNPLRSSALSNDKQAATNFTKRPKQPQITASSGQQSATQRGPPRPNLDELWGSEDELA